MAVANVTRQHYVLSPACTQQSRFDRLHHDRFCIDCRICADPVLVPRPNYICPYCNGSTNTRRLFPLNWEMKCFPEEEWKRTTAKVNVKTLERHAIYSRYDQRFQQVLHFRLIIKPCTYCLDTLAFEKLMKDTEHTYADIDYMDVQ